MLTLYLETTVPSYLVAQPSRDLIVASHQEMTQEWWLHERSKYDIYISQLLLDEIHQGDPSLAAARVAAVADLPLLDLTRPVEELALEYARELNIPRRALTDAYHLAFAVQYEVDFLLTWNCAHLANGVTRSRLQKVNLGRGWHLPVIVTPEELLPAFDSE
jgi:predicted nucleic acid-binding protein